MANSFSQRVRSEFEKGEELTLDELYEILSKNPLLKVDPSKLKHRIRSTIYSLQKANEIVRLRDATYKKAISPK